MVNENFKIETKGSLYRVEFVRGEYSDKDECVFVFSANSLDEAKLSIKKWLSSGGVISEGNWYGSIESEGYLGIVFEDGERYIAGDKKENELNWDTGYGEAWDVKISMLNVIYVKH